jgi:hypothetical protein
MEISPIANVSITPMVRSKATDLGLTDVYDIERSSSIGDETYSPGSAKPGAGDYEGDSDDSDGQDDEELYDDLEDSGDTKPETQPAKSGQIDYIA